jgi:hypothetical protein
LFKPLITTTTNTNTERGAKYEYPMDEAGSYRGDDMDLGFAAGGIEEYEGDIEEYEDDIEARYLQQGTGVSASAGTAVLALGSPSAASPVLQGVIELLPTGYGFDSSSSIVIIQQIIDKEKLAASFPKGAASRITAYATTLNRIKVQLKLDMEEQALVGPELVRRMEYDPRNAQIGHFMANMHTFHTDFHAELIEYIETCRRIAIATYDEKVTIIKVCFWNHTKQSSEKEKLDNKTRKSMMMAGI